MKNLLRLFDKAADAVAATMLAVIFATFLYQIAARYLFGWSVGWTIELNLTLWLWLVLFGAAFVLRENDHVRFDMFYQAASPGRRKAFIIISSAAIAAAFLIALPAVYDYVSFYKIKKSATLRWRLNNVYSIYLVFSVVIGLRYVWRIALALKGHDFAEDDVDLTKVD